MSMDISGANSINMRPIFGGYPFQGKNKLRNSISKFKSPDL